MHLTSKLRTFWLVLSTLMSAVGQGLSNVNEKTPEQRWRLIIITCVQVFFCYCWHQYNGLGVLAAGGRSPEDSPVQRGPRDGLSAALPADLL